MLFWGMWHRDGLVSRVFLAYASETSVITRPYVATSQKTAFSIITAVKKSHPSFPCGDVLCSWLHYQCRCAPQWVRPLRSLDFPVFLPNFLTSEMCVMLPWASFKVINGGLWDGLVVYVRPHTAPKATWNQKRREVKSSDKMWPWTPWK
jgi:hypothetical protein